MFMWSLDVSFSTLVVSCILQQLSFFKDREKKVELVTRLGKQRDE